MKEKSIGFSKIFKKITIIFSHRKKSSSHLSKAGGGALRFGYGDLYIFSVRREPSKLGGEKIIRQTQQKSARVVDPTRRFFVKSPQGGLTDKIPSILCMMNF